jgi:hypothetical protein
MFFVKAAMAAIVDHERETGLLDLPESCISAIFSFTTPRDICRLSVVSKLFKSVAFCDVLWNKFLPIECHQIVSRADLPLPTSKRELYARLGDSILIDGGAKMAWLERSTAKMGYMLSARGLTIIWGDDERYWRFVPGDGHDSRFQVLAELSLVWWLEVRGQIDCSLLSPNTNYKVVFVLKFGEHPYGWEVPIKFSVTTPDGEQTELEECLNERRGQNQGINGGWMEVVGGEFTVRPAADDDDPRIEFYMKEVLRRIPKGGLLLDGVRIQPQ